MASRVRPVTDKNFHAEVLSSPKPVLVEYWAAWCGPCKQLAPILEAVALDAVGFGVAKMNVDENPKTALAYNVMTLPTLMVFSGGEVVKQLPMVRSKTALMREMSEYA